MKYRIMYCDKCDKEYECTLSNYGEKCPECNQKLEVAWKVKEKEYSCIKLCRR